MKDLERKESLPSVGRRGEFKPSTLNEELREVEVTFTTGARVKRFGLFGDGFVEELAVGKKNVRLSRLNNGANLLNNHRAGNLDDIIGVVESASISRDGVGLATVRFAKSEEGEKAFQGVKDGILRNISVGYRIHKFEELDAESDGTRVFRAVDWEPMELSLVTIPADSGAQVRSSSNEYPCYVITKGVRDMENRSDAPESKKTDQANVSERKVDTEALTRKAVEDERNRSSEIKRSAQALGLGEDVYGRMIEDGMSAEAAKTALIEERSKKDKETQTRSTNVEVTAEQADKVRAGIFNAVCHRANSRRNKLDDAGREFRGLSLSEMAKFCIGQTGEDVSRMSKDQVWKRMISLRNSGMHTTSDFSLVLEDLMNKTLRQSYEASPSVWQPIVREVTVSDFKQISRVQLGDAPSLKKLAESGEIEAGTVGEQAEKYQVETYARKVTISRQALVNDDLSAFTRLPELFGRRARDLENDLVWVETIIANPAMADTVSIFDAAHGNLLTGGGSALAVAGLSAARSAMRKQKSQTTNNEEMPISATPAYIFVPPELETTADQLITQISADQAGNVNPFAGRLQVGVEPRLSDGVAGGATRWFMTGDADQIDIIEMARLAGEEGPVIESEEMFDVEGMKVKARMDVGVKCIDYRALVRNEGA